MGYLAAKMRWSGWLQYHISGQLGSYIAMTTAVLVVNVGKVWWAWILPTIIGSPIISWLKREVLRRPQAQIPARRAVRRCYAFYDCNPDRWLARRAMLGIRTISQRLVEIRRGLPRSVRLQENFAVACVPGRSFQMDHQQAPNAAPPPFRIDHQPMNHRLRAIVVAAHGQRHRTDDLSAISVHYCARRFSQPHALGLPPPAIEEFSAKIALRPFAHSNALAQSAMPKFEPASNIGIARIISDVKILQQNQRRQCFQSMGKLQHSGHLKSIAL